MARGLYIGGKQTWLSAPDFAFESGLPGTVSLATYLHNPRNRSITYSAPDGLPTGCSISGASFIWNGSGVASSGSITLRATSANYATDISASYVITESNWAGIPNQSLTVGVAYSLDLKNYDPPDTGSYAVNAGGDDLPDGLTLNENTGVISGTPTTAQTKNVAFDATSSAEADWLARSSAPGVVWATLFDTDAKVNNYRFTNGVGLDLNPAPGSTGSYVRRLADGGIMGNGCLELEQLTNGNMNSYWWRPFNPALTQYQMTGAGGDKTAGQGFYLQVRVKTNCGGDSSTGGGGRKVFSVSRTENSYTWQEIVAQDTLYRGVFQMYQGMGAGNVQYASFEAPAGGSDYNFQPGSEFAVAPAYCSYQAGNYENQAACFTWNNNEWITYLMYVLPATDQTANGAVTVWAWKAGWPDYVRIMHKTNLWMRYDTDKTYGFNAVLLWIYETGRTAGPANQKQWYDQVILSTQTIARPQA